MKLTCKQDIDAPADYVLAQITDYDGWERAAMRRGVEIDHKDKRTSTGTRQVWLSRFRYRGRERSLEISANQGKADGAVDFSLVSALADGTLGVEVVAMASQRSRVFVSIEVLPKTFAARLYVQSLKLAKARVEKKLAQRSSAFANEIEARFARLK